MNAVRAYLIKTAAGVRVTEGNVPFSQQVGNLMASLPGMGGTSYGKSRAWLGDNQGGSSARRLLENHQTTSGGNMANRLGRVNQMTAGHQQRLQGLGRVGVGLGVAGLGYGLYRMLRGNPEEKQRQQQMQQMQMMQMMQRRR